MGVQATAHRAVGATLGHKSGPLRAEATLRPFTGMGAQRRAHGRADGSRIPLTGLLPLADPRSQPPTVNNQGGIPVLALQHVLALHLRVLGDLPAGFQTWGVIHQ
mmetsp:Transcript_25905/g.33595  ORF Transcript_25905/g.33595 Transcript_25905/m.33595 type:complete len:105 (+) Transcript_25905:380-694(+)